MFLSDLDSDWKNLIERMGNCTLSPYADRQPFEALVRSVAYQQLHSSAGDSILKRLIGDGDFPSPEALLQKSEEELGQCGFSLRKIDTLYGIAEATLKGVVPDLEIANNLSDKELIFRLLGIKGVGQWTIEMMLIFSLGRMDVLPTSDLGVRKGYQKLKQQDSLVAPNDLLEIGKAWSPYRTIATWYLWRA